MRETSYTDDEGRQWAVQVPDGVSDADASLGIPLGPPSLESLGLPLEFEVRLHNQLCARRLFTFKDMKTRRMEIMGALQAALRVDIVALTAIYRAEEPPAVVAQPKKSSAPKRGQQRKRRR